MNDQIEVKPGAAPEVFVTIARYLAAMLGGWLVGRGWVTADQLPQLTGVVVGAVPLIWGAWATFRTKKVMIAAADPNSATELVLKKPD